MRGLWRLALIAALLGPVAVQAREGKAQGCESSVGAWEFTDMSGRAVILKDGAAYHIVYVLSAGGDSYGVASACTCESAAGKLLWSCDVRFSLNPAQVGTRERYEWVFDGDTIQSRSVAPEGQRGDVVNLRRAK